MPVSVDSTIVAQALALARSLGRQAKNNPLSRKAKVEVASTLAASVKTFDGALEALKRIEDTVPIKINDVVIGYVDPAYAHLLAQKVRKHGVDYTMDFDPPDDRS